MTPTTRNQADQFSNRAMHCSLEFKSSKQRKNEHKSNRQTHSVLRKLQEMNVQKSALAKRGHWDANTEQLGLMGIAKN